MKMSVNEQDETIYLEHLYDHDPEMTTEQQAVHALQRSLLRVWDDIDEHLAELKNPFAEAWNLLGKSMADCNWKMLQSDHDANIKQFSEPLYACQKMMNSLQELFQSKDCQKIMGSSAQLKLAIKTGLPLSVIDCFVIRGTKKGLIIEDLEPMMVDEKYLNHRMWSAAHHLTEIGQFTEELLHALPKPTGGKRIHEEGSN